MRCEDLLVLEWAVRYAKFSPLFPGIEKLRVLCSLRLFHPPGKKAAQQLH